MFAMLWVALTETLGWEWLLEPKGWIDKHGHIVTRPI